MKALPRRRRRARGDVRRDRDRAARGHGRERRRRARLRPRRRSSSRSAPAGSRCSCRGRSLMARKLRGFQRVLDAPALFSVAYGEIASSIYFALGIVAAYALGLTPLVLLGAGVFFLHRLALVRRGDGRDPGDRRRRDLRPAGVQRPARLPDRLGALPRLPDRDRALDAVPAALPRHGARRSTGCASRPWDIVVAVCVIVAITGVRLVAPLAAPHRRARDRRPRPRDAAPARDPRPRAPLRAGPADAGDVARLVARRGATSRSRCRSRCSPTPGLETVANLAEETREPGRTLPRSLFSAIGLVVVLTVLIAIVGLSAFPVENGETALGDEWLEAPLAGIVAALDGPLPGWLGDALRVYVGLTGALVLLAAATTSISGFTRLAHSLGEHGQLPRSFGRLNRRTLVSPQAIVAAAVDLVGARDRDGASSTTTSSSWRASTPSASCSRSPRRSSRCCGCGAPSRDLRAPVPRTDRRAAHRRAARDRWSGCSRSSRIPGRGTPGRPGSRSGSPSTSLVRRREHARAASTDIAPIERAAARRGLQAHPRADEARPDRRGDGRDRRRARQGPGRRRGCALRDPSCRSSYALDAALHDKEEQAAASLAEAALLGEEHGVEVEPVTVRARSIGQAIVEQAAPSATRPDRARLVPPLAAPVRVLLADRRLRPPQRAVRGARRRLPARRPGETLGCEHEAGRDRLRTGRLGRRARVHRATAGT